MSVRPEPDDRPQESPESELMDSIGAALPPHHKAAFYRELLHCQSLREDDEMLRIIRILQILTYLIHQAPAMLMTERKFLDARLVSLNKGLERAVRSIREYQKQFDRRLAELPQDIAKRIQAERIAGAISESVRQEFARTGLSRMAQGFQATYADLEKVVAGLEKTLRAVEGAEERAVERIGEGGQRVLGTMDAVSASFAAEAERLSRKTRWQRDMLASIVIAITFLLGMQYARWLDAPPAPTMERTIVPKTQQAAPAIVQPTQRNAH